jgi:hypothetical protein
METTERIVEAYVRYIKRWATIPNIRCEGQLEIDLLAIDPGKIRRYHIESGVSVSGSYSKLTNHPYSDNDLKTRVKQAGQRRTLGYFRDRKFGDKNVLARLKEYGFSNENYQKIIVTWGWQNGVEEAAKAEGILLWDFRHLIADLAAAFRNQRTYFGDDTLRTLHLYALAGTEKSVT